MGQLTKQSRFDNVWLQLQFTKLKQVWDLATLQLVKTLEGHAEGVNALVIVGDLLFSGSDDKTLKVWNINSFNCIATVSVSNCVKALTASSSSAQIIAGIEL